MGSQDGELGLGELGGLLGLGKPLGVGWGNPARPRAAPGLLRNSVKNLQVNLVREKLELCNETINT